jgi:hypothetical protein
MLPAVKHGSQDPAQAIVAFGELSLHTSYAPLAHRIDQRTRLQPTGRIPGSEGRRVAHRVSTHLSHARGHSHQSAEQPAHRSSAWRDRAHRQWSTSITAPTPRLCLRTNIDYEPVLVALLPAMRRFSAAVSPAFPTRHLAITSVYLRVSTHRDRPRRPRMTSTDGPSARQDCVLAPEPATGDGRRAHGTRWGLTLSTPSK